MAETILIKGAIGVVLLWALAFPSGVLYARRKLGKNWVATVIGIGFSGLGIIIAAPEFEPVVPSVVAILLLGAAGAIGARASFVLFR